jgi:hypothetical protein
MGVTANDTEIGIHFARSFAVCSAG